MVNCSSLTYLNDLCHLLFAVESQNIEVNTIYQKKYLKINFINVTANISNNWVHFGSNYVYNKMNMTNASNLLRIYIQTLNGVVESTD